jgi:hypothetical protein
VPGEDDEDLASANGASEDGDGAEPADPFALVGNEIRAEIVRVFGDPPVEEVLSYSEVLSRIDADLHSSQLNYHLQRLVGHFLARTDDGYRMRPEGRVLYRALAAGTFDRRPSPSARAVGVDCYYCDAPVEGRFEGGAVEIVCPVCEYLYDVATLPPGVVDDAVDGPNGGDGRPCVDLDAVARYAHQMHLSYARRICPTCGNRMDAAFSQPAEVPLADDGRREAYVALSCSHCDSRPHLSVGEVALVDPELIAFCHDHGVDVFETALWELPFAATDRGVTVRSTDPWRVELAVEYDGETLALVFDESLDVVERARR